MTPEEFNAKYGKAARGEETFAEAVARARAPQASSAPVATASASRPAPRAAPRAAPPTPAPAVPQGPPMPAYVPPPQELDPGLRSDPPLTYGKAMGLALQQRAEPMAAGTTAMSDAAAGGTKAVLDAASLAKRRIQDLLKQAPSPDEILTNRWAEE